MIRGYGLLVESYEEECQLLRYMNQRHERRLDEVDNEMNWLHRVRI